MALYFCIWAVACLLCLGVYIFGDGCISMGVVLCNDVYNCVAGACASEGLVIIV